MKVIGILCWPVTEYGRTYVRTSEYFVHLTERFGALPLIIPTFDQKDPLEPLLEVVDGLIFAGVGDVGSFSFGEDPHPASGTIDWRRDDFELRLYRAARVKGLPVLGVCRGMQLINIAHGGDIYQDLPQTGDPYVHHRGREGGQFSYHRIVNQSGLMRDLFGEEIIVNSSHHQGVRKVGEGLVATSFSADGLVEVIENEDQSVIGTQFHPEFEDHQPWAPALFEHLIHRAKDKDRQ